MGVLIQNARCEVCSGIVNRSCSMRCASDSFASKPSISSRPIATTHRRRPSSAFRSAQRLGLPLARHDGLTCSRRVPASHDRGTRCASSGTEGARASTEQADAPASTVPPASADSPGPDSQESSQPRLFSNLNERTLRHEPGSVLGAAALVAGTTVGAGILALPYATKVPLLPWKCRDEHAHSDGHTRGMKIC